MSTITIPAAPNAEAITGLEPARVWHFFASLASVPRPSGFEEQIRAHVAALAEAHGLEHRRDGTGNMVIDVPATPGHEGAPIVVLQGHLDMVAEQNAGTDHDFENDPIRLVVDESKDRERIVRARGTTLGADNGMGVALALAAATDPDVAHGPLELLLTSDEEVGMTGAKALAENFVRGRTLLNLDSEEDDAIYVGCAGGADVALRWAVPTTDPGAGLEGVTVTVNGLAGGHSGCDIHLGRGNAIKIGVAILIESGVEGLRLASIDGGSKRNAIPREATLVAVVPVGRIADVEHAASEVATRLQDSGETGVTIAVEPIPAVPSTDFETAMRILRCLHALPSGVLAVVPAMPELVQTSNNLSTITSSNVNGVLRIEVGCLTRSSNAASSRTATSGLAALAALGGAASTVGNDYPGWQPNPTSALLGTCREVYQKMFGEPAHVTAIHAGLECGIIGERLPGSDMLSIGPRIEGAHSPDEHVYVESVAKSYRFLSAILTRLADA